MINLSRGWRYPWQTAEPFSFTLDAQPVQAYPGETIAAALLAAGIRTLRRTSKSGAPRGIFCGMGVCFDCLVVVDGRPHLRACLTDAKPGDSLSLAQTSGIGDGTVSLANVQGTEYFCAVILTGCWIGDFTPTPPTTGMDGTSPNGPLWWKACLSACSASGLIADIIATAWTGQERPVRF